MVRPLWRALTFGRGFCFTLWAIKDPFGNLLGFIVYTEVEEVPQNMFCISSATENITMEVPQKILI